MNVHLRAIRNNIARNFNFFASLVAIVCFVCSPTGVLAAPAITSVGGTIGNGETITITGTGFGTTGPSIAIFDDFEKGTNGAHISTASGNAAVGGWALNASNAPHYSSSFANSGTKSFQADWTDDGLSEGGRWTEAQFGGTNQVYFSFWIYLPSNRNVPGTNSSGGPNWKWVMLSGNPWPKSDYTTVFLTDLPAQNGTWQLPNPWYDPSGLSELGYGNQTSFTKGKWHRYEYYFYGHTSQGIIGMWELNSTTVRKQLCYRTGLYNLHSSDLWGLVRFPAYGRGDSNSQTYYDDFYVAIGNGALARVEIGNNATYSNCTNLAVITPTSWSSNSITATVRQGGFAAGSSAYLFVIDSAGAVSPGYPVTIGSGGPSPAPASVSAPTGLRIVPN